MRQQASQAQEDDQHTEAEEFVVWAKAWDDVMGTELSPTQVMEARQTEKGYGMDETV